MKQKPEGSISTFIVGAILTDIRRYASPQNTNRQEELASNETFQTDNKYGIEYGTTVPLDNIDFSVEIKILCGYHCGLMF